VIFSGSGATPEAQNRPGSTGLIRTCGGDVIHCDDCRYAQSDSAVRWDWADGRAHIEIRAAAAENGLKLCSVCHPACGEGSIRTAGAWVRPWNSGHAHDLYQITREDGTVLAFDPPNILFIAGGQRVRIERYETDRPVLAVERFSGEIDRYQMRIEPAAADLGAGS